jgi:hypothetical protein
LKMPITWARWHIAVNHRREWLLDEIHPATNCAPCVRLVQLECE